MTPGQPQEALEVVNEPQRLACALSPLRKRLLEQLRVPDSAAGLARRLGLPRQKVNYHCRELEKQGFLELLEERRRRGCVERRYRVAAADFLVNPTVLSQPSSSPTQERFSSAYQLRALAATLRDVATLRERARGAGKPLATLTLETEVALGSAKELQAFSEELAQAIATVVAKYHRPKAGSRRRYGFLGALRPTITKSSDEAAAEAADYREKEVPKP